MTFHRWVIHSRVPDYLRLGWMALPTLEGTHHGNWSAHCVWLCGCRLVEPESPPEDDFPLRMQLISQLLNVSQKRLEKMLAIAGLKLVRK